jgi:topoisomerase IA-like protein
LAVGKQKVKLPKGTAAEELTLEECLAFAGDQLDLDPNKPKAKKGAKGASAKKETTKKETTKKTSVKKTPTKKASNGATTAVKKK